MIGTASVRTPAHLWLVGVLALLWNGFGCLDYSMTVTRDPTWMAQLSPDVINWLDAAPAWAVGSWALGVWGGLLGALLLLIRSRWSVAAFMLSLLGLAVNQTYQFLNPMPGAAANSGQLALTATIWIIAIILLYYSSRMRTRGVLK